MINRLAIIGVGLIGGSLSLALKKAGQVGEVIGYSRTESVRQEALDLGVIDRAASSIADAVKDADVIFLAVPMGAMASVLTELAPHLKDNTIITDGGSAKAQVVAAARATSHLPHLLAFNLVGMLAKSADCDEVLRFAAGGFRDFSRIASGDSVMWRDICLSNSAAILALLNDYRQGLDSLEQAIMNSDGDYLVEVFKRAKQARDTRFAEPNLVDNSEV